MERLPFEIVAIIVDNLKKADQSEHCSSCCLLYASKAYSQVIAPHLYNNPLCGIGDLKATKSASLKWSKLFRTLFLSAEGRTSLPYLEYVDNLQLDSFTVYFEECLADRPTAATFVDAVDFEEISKGSEQIKKLMGYANDTLSLTNSDFKDIAQFVIEKVAATAINTTKLDTLVLTRSMLPLLYHTQSLMLYLPTHIEVTRRPEDIRISRLHINIHGREICQAAAAFIAALSPNSIEEFIFVGTLPAYGNWFTIFSKHRLSLRSLTLNHNLQDAVMCEVAALPEFTCLEECDINLVDHPRVNMAKAHNYFLVASQIPKNSPRLRRLDISYRGANNLPIAPLLSSLKHNET